MNQIISGSCSPESPRALGRIVKTWQEDISSAKELALKDKDQELKKSVESIANSLVRGINMLKAFIRCSPRFEEMQTTRFAFTQLGYILPSLLEKQFALKSLEKKILMVQRSSQQQRRSGHGSSFPKGTYTHVYMKKLSSSPSIFSKRRPTR